MITLDTPFHAGQHEADRLPAQARQEPQLPANKGTTNIKLNIERVDMPCSELSPLGWVPQTR
jgi:hypothetical protein